MSSSAFADDVLIELSPEQPYVDLPITVETPSTVTVTTTTGDPRALGFIDSWVEIWQDTIRLGYNDDGGHTATNYLASLLSLPLDAGTYFIKATSYAWAVTNGNQTPTGNYTLTWSGAVLASPTATPTPTVTPTETPTPEPTPSPVETESPTPSPTPEPSQETTPLPIPEPVIDNSDNEEILSVVTPETLPTPEPTPTLEPEPEITEQIIEPETIATPVLEPELSVEELEEQMQEQIIQEYIAENTLELEIPTALADIPGIAEVFAATEAILNVGSDMTPEQREESQGVVIAAVLVQQIAQISAVGAMSRRNK
jgi:hypothetical protein